MNYVWVLFQSTTAAESPNTTTYDAQFAIAHSGGRMTTRRLRGIPTSGAPIVGFATTGIGANNLI